MTFHRIAIAGATGYLGKRVLSHLLTIPSISKITVLTRPDSSENLSISPIVSVIPIESYEDQVALTKALQGHDILVSTINGLASDYIDPLLISAAIVAGIRRFMPSEYTLDVMHPHSRAVAGSTILASKIRNAKAIQTMAKNGQIEYTTIVTGGILDWWFENGDLGVNAAQRKATLYDGGEIKTSGSTTDFIARCVGAVITNTSPEDTKNRRIRVAEVAYTGKEILEAFEEVSGEKWRVEERSTESLLEDGRKACENGDMRGFYMSNILKLNFDGKGAGFFDEGLKQWEGHLHRRSLKEIVRQVDEAGKHFA